MSTDELLSLLTGQDLETLKCPDCMSKGTHQIKTVQHLLGAGNDAVIVPITELVCGQCGHYWLHAPSMEKLDAAYAKLKSGDSSGWQKVGEVYQA